VRPKVSSQCGQSVRSMPGRTTASICSAGPRTSERAGNRGARQLACDETVDMSGQVRQHRGAAQAGVLSERHQHRRYGATPSGCYISARMANQHEFDLRADPARPDPIHGPMLDKVGMRHRVVRVGQIQCSDGVDTLRL
jgi:hypothetical protein